MSDARVPAPREFAVYVSPYISAASNEPAVSVNVLDNFGRDGESTTIVAATHEAVAIQCAAWVRDVVAKRLRAKGAP